MYLHKIGQEKLEMMDRFELDDLIQEIVVRGIMEMVFLEMVAVHLVHQCWGCKTLLPME